MRTLQNIALELYRCLEECNMPTCNLDFFGNERAKPFPEKHLPKAVMRDYQCWSTSMVFQTKSINT